VYDAGTEHMKKEIIIAATLFACVSVSARSTLRGTVTDERNGPLAGASVVLDAQGTGTVTDAAGTFVFGAVSEGPHRLKISFVGYAPLDTMISMGAGDQTVLLRLKSETFLLGEAQVGAVRASSRVPIAQSIVTKDDIARINTGVDLPYLLDQQPSVVTTSDGGTGIGYTGLRIRGSDPTRINVTINGVPLNDAESATVYWVDLPDFASSTEDAQLQRGVGTSTNGPGAFGASINLRTSNVRTAPFAQVDLGGGSFNTLRASAQAGSGLIGGHASFDARLSTIQSDGYIDRATADLKSYFLQGAWIGKKNALRLITFGGHEVTYQAWAGVPREVIDTNRTFNPYSYDNEVDDYTQTHYQLLFDQKLGERSLLNITLFRVDGSGFYENYETEADMASFGLSPVNVGSDTITSTDLIQRRWLDNTLMGANASVKTSFGQHELVVGGSYSDYQGDHFGEVIWARYAGESEIRDRYYENDAEKTDANAFARLTYALSDRTDLYLDAQWRGVTYDFLGYDADLENVTQSVSYGFFNPKVGIMGKFGDHQRAYFSVAVANKEPNRDDLVDSSPASRPAPERLIDLETGYRFERDRITAGINLYYMDYRDQLVLTGELNDVGAYTRVNVPQSYRTGVELTAALKITDRLMWSWSATFSHNKAMDFVEYVDNWDSGLQFANKYQEVDLAFSPSVIAGSELGFRFLSTSGSAPLI
jgi:iron complex outermembrane receptor protein